MCGVCTVGLFISLLAISVACSPFLFKVYQRGCNLYLNFEQRVRLCFFMSEVCAL